MRIVLFVLAFFLVFGGEVARADGPTDPDLAQSLAEPTSTSTSGDTIVIPGSNESLPAQKSGPSFFTTVMTWSVLLLVLVALLAATIAALKNAKDTWFPPKGNPETATP